MSLLNIQRKFLSKLFLVLLVTATIGSILNALIGNVYGAQLQSRSLTLTNSQPSVISTYNIGFSLVNYESLGAVLIQFCSNDPLQGDVCQAPAGFNDLSAVLSAQSGINNFSINNLSTVNTIFLQSSSPSNASGPIGFTLDNITNPSSPGSYYARIQTFTQTNGSGTANDFGGIAFAITSAINITAEVPPYILFCTGINIPNDNCTDATGSYVNFGFLANGVAGQGTSQMLAATNAVSGYAITVYGTSLESGINIVNPIYKSDISRPGTSQFGFNLVANSSPSGGLNPSGNGGAAPVTGYNKPNYYQFNSGDIIASYPKPDYDKLYTASYIVNIPATQPPGVYVTTLTYICVATF